MTNFTQNSAYKNPTTSGNQVSGQKDPTILLGILDFIISDIVDI